MTPTGGEHKKLNAILDTVVDRYCQRSAEEQEQFKGQLASFRNLYLFLSQVIPYQDSDLEKLYSFGRFLLTKLPPTAGSAAVRIDGDVELQYYRLQKISEGSINLKEGQADYLKGPTDVGTGRPDEQVQLSTLVEALNERFGTDFTLADQLFFEQVRQTAAQNERLRRAATANTIDNFAPVFNKELENLFIERMEGNEEIFQRLMNDDEFRTIAAKHLMQAVYDQIRRGEE